jgi:hypothetical protein
MPTPETEEDSSSIPLALQGLFYKVRPAPALVRRCDCQVACLAAGRCATRHFLGHSAGRAGAMTCVRLSVLRDPRAVGPGITNTSS